MANEKTQEGLIRVVGFSGLTLTIVGFTIGSGIFALPTIAGMELGAFAVFGNVFCGIMLAAIILCYAEIGSLITTISGSYTYVEAEFGKLAGFESTLGASGEIKNPKRTVPLGILFGGILVLTVYFLLQAVTEAILGSQMAAYKDAPLAAATERIVGSIGGTILLLTAAISCFGTVSADMLNTPRVLFAGAKVAVFPKFPAKVHQKFAIPHRAIIGFATLIFILSMSGGFEQLAILASVAILLIYIAVILATIRLRKQKQDAAEKTFKAPGGLVTPFIGIAAILWLLGSLSKWQILSTVIFIAAICVIYFVMKKLQTQKTNAHLVNKP